MPNPPTLSAYVSVRGRFLRSIHLERDFSSATHQDYHLTESASNALQALRNALEQPAHRAMTLVGPYGAGKSAFGVYAANLLSATLPTESHLTLSPYPIQPVLLVGSRQPLAQALISALLRTLEMPSLKRQRKLLTAEAHALLATPNPEARAVANLYLRTAQLLREAGTGGLLLIVDELGKFLEYAALHPKQGDIFVLQEIAEAAARSAETPLLILGILHQGVEAYAQRLGQTAQREWAKVSERFRPLPFHPSDGERMEMVGRALCHDTRLPLQTGMEPLIAACLTHCPLPPGLERRFPALARAAYPLHPMTLLALPILFRKMGQSHRSLFGFLTGEEPYAFGSFLRETEVTPDALPLFSPDRLFDYAADTLVVGRGVSGLSQQWAEATEMIDRAEHLTPNQIRLLKCIGLFNLLRDPRLKAEEAVLALALTGSEGVIPDLTEDLRALAGRRLITYSRLRQTYRLWEGGDIDISEVLALAHQGQDRSVTLHVARELCPPPRLLAQRHSYQTGAVRLVSARVCHTAEMERAVAESTGQLTLLFCLAQSPEERERGTEQAASLASSHLAVAVTQETDILSEAAADVAAAHQVAQDLRTQLEGDRPARRELETRRQEAETVFRREWERLFRPQEEAAVWYYQGQARSFQNSREFSTFLSEMADNTYHATPRLQNELINRRHLSSAAAAGRRNLIEAMWTRADRPHLGLVGFPPERSMYECLLRASGLHQEAEPGVWAFTAPPSDNPTRLHLGWQALEAWIFAETPEPRSVAELFATLSGSPYGLTEGVLPVLLCAFLLTYPDETTLYREGTFLPEPGVPDWEVLMRRPELFAVAGSRLIGERAWVVQRLAERLHLRPYPAAVVRGLIRMVQSLPAFAWKTRRLAPETLALREAFQKARSPERLLFHDMPLALGVTFFAQEAADSSRVEPFFQSLNAALQDWGQVASRTQTEARNTLLTACGLTAGTTGWAELRQLAQRLEGRVIHPVLFPFLGRAAELGDDGTVLDKTLAQVSGRPSNSWLDRDFENFAGQAQTVGELFQQAVEALHHPVTLAPDTETLDALEHESSQQLLAQLRQTVREHLQKDTSPRILQGALLTLLHELNTVSGDPTP